MTTHRLTSNVALGIFIAAASINACMSTDDRSRRVIATALAGSATLNARVCATSDVMRPSGVLSQ